MTRSKRITLLAGGAAVPLIALAVASRGGASRSAPRGQD
jgi:hypothetical protein